MGYGEQAKVQVITDAARDLAGRVWQAAPTTAAGCWTGRTSAESYGWSTSPITPLAYGRLTPNGSAFELWDLFVRFRCYVWTGQTGKWQTAGQELYELLELREEVDTQGLAMQARLTRRRLVDALGYLEANINSLIDYRRYQQAGRRISTGYVESSINRLIGRRMCKDQHMRWSRTGADGVVQVRVALQKPRTR